MNIKLSFFKYMMIFFLLALWGCEGDVSTVSEDPYGPVEDAAVSFGVKWPDASGEDAVRSMAASLTDMSAECAARGVDKVRVRVMENVTWDRPPAILKSATFDCSAGQGTLTSIEPQEYCTIFVSGLNFISNVIYEGTKRNVPLHPGMNNVGTIDLTGIVAPPGDIANTFGMTFNYISPGTFMMGSPPEEFGRQHGHEQQHQVTLSQGYYIQTTPVTQGQWEAVMGSNPSYFSNCGADCPVENLSWDDVQDFIAMLNAFEGTGKYGLPTEAQWEYAVRAGSTTAFANGPIEHTEEGYDPVLDRMGWYAYNSNISTHPVAQKEPNAWGLYDVHGNVFEWVSDWYEPYPTTSAIDPTGPQSGTLRVWRGGSFNNSSWVSRSANRSLIAPDYRGSSGFRLVLLDSH